MYSEYWSLIGYMICKYLLLFYRLPFYSMWVKSLSRVRLFVTSWTIAYQPPPSMGFFQARILEWVAIAISAKTLGFKKNCSVFHWQCHVHFRCTAKWFSCIYFFRFFSILSYYKVLSIILCAVQLVFVVYLFYIQ